MAEMVLNFENSVIANLLYYEYQLMKRDWKYVIARNDKHNGMANLQQSYISWVEHNKHIIFVEHVYLYILSSCVGY